MPEKGNYQELNEKFKNNLLYLGKGCIETSPGLNDGKKSIDGNINMKPSEAVNMYEYDEDNWELERRYVDDFPIYQTDSNGIPFDPKKAKDGSEFVYTASCLDAPPK